MPAATLQGSRRACRRIRRDAPGKRLDARFQLAPGRKAIDLTKPAVLILGAALRHRPGGGAQVRRHWATRPAGRPQCREAGRRPRRYASCATGSRSRCMSSTRWRPRPMPISRRACPNCPGIVVSAVGLMGEQAESERDTESAVRVLRSNFEGPRQRPGGLCQSLRRKGCGHARRHQLGRGRAGAGDELRLRLGQGGVYRFSLGAAQSAGHEGRACGDGSARFRCDANDRRDGPAGAGLPPNPKRLPRRSPGLSRESGMSFMSGRSGS